MSSYFPLILIRTQLSKKEQLFKNKPFKLILRLSSQEKGIASQFLLLQTWYTLVPLFPQNQTKHNTVATKCTASAMAVLVLCHKGPGDVPCPVPHAHLEISYMIHPENIVLCSGFFT